MIGRRGAQLAMLHTGYRAKPSVFEPVPRTEVKNGNFLQSGVRELYRFLAQNPYWLQPPYARAAERLVEAGMASGWVDVGPPVAVCSRSTRREPGGSSRASARRSILRSGRPSERPYPGAGGLAHRMKRKAPKWE